MVKNELVEAMKSNIKSVIPEIETFIKNRESIIASYVPIRSVSFFGSINLIFLLSKRS